MGPYAFTQAFLSGFFGFSAVAAFVIWSRSRRDSNLLILAIGSCIWAAQSAAVVYLATSDTIAEAQRALDLRTIFGALSVAATAWMFAEITGVRAQGFVWFATMAMIGVAASTAAGARLIGEVTSLDRVALPWERSFQSLLGLTTARSRSRSTG